MQSNYNIETLESQAKMIQNIGFLEENLPNIDEVEESEKSTKQNQATILLRQIEESNIDFFHDEIETPYAAVQVDEHIEVLPINSTKFKILLRKSYYEKCKGALSSETLTSVIGVLDGKALFDGKKQDLFVRLANKDGEIYYDLTNEKWQAVRITSTGWEVVNSPILFTHYNHQQPQVYPEKGGNIKLILNHVNIKPQHHLLFIVWLVSCFVPDIPHVMPIAYGEKGSAKTTFCEFMKAIIDPSALSTLTLSNDTKSVIVNMKTHYFLPFDNVSRINEETSDTLCRAITGGGVQQRKLYTNDESTIFKFKRCMAINGINNVASRADLLDRSLLIELERVLETNRKEITEIKAAFEKDLPQILGGIFDIISKAMSIYPTVKLPTLPRMADFCKWGYAIAEAMGISEMNF